MMLSLLASADPAPPAADKPPSFIKDVRLFLSNYCRGCHNSRRGAKSDYGVESYASVMKKGKKGPMVVPGKPDESRLVMSLEGKGKPMPPKPCDQPTADEIAMIRAWIKAGALDDKPAEKNATSDK